jgi:hypothetical protein
MVKIADRKTIVDWQRFRGSLVVGAKSSLWQKAYREYFLARLNLRYIDPIKILKEQGALTGEGFSILTIQCSLIEFLESTAQGTNYRYLRRNETIGIYEYSSSKQIFIKFLCTRIPFSREFNDKIAMDFYTGIRCGLIHEAQTKCGWKVRAKSPDGTMINHKKLIVYRDDFQRGLDEFIKWYGVVIQSDIAIQGAFIRKFDSLCR